MVVTTLCFSLFERLKLGVDRAVPGRGDLIGAPSHQGGFLP